MSIDELTDEAFFDLYQKNPQIKEIVDRIQRKYHTHFSQKGQPGYNKANIPIAMREAKETVEGLLTKKTTAPATATASQKAQYAVGLLGGLASAIAFSISPLLGIATLVTTAYIVYQSQYKPS